MILQKFAVKRDQLVKPRRFEIPPNVYHQRDYYVGMQNIWQQIGQQEDLSFEKKPEVVQGSLDIKKEGEKLDIDGFILLARESDYLSDDSFENEEDFEHNYSPYNKPEEDYAMKMQANNYGLGYKSNNGDEHDLSTINKEPYRNRMYMHEYEMVQDLYSGPFNIKKMDHNKNHEYQQIQKEESMQITRGIWKIYNEDNGNTFDNKCNNYGSNKIHLNGTSMNGSEPIIGR